MCPTISNHYGDSSGSIQIIITLQTKSVLITHKTYRVVDGDDHAVNYGTAETNVPSQIEHGFVLPKCRIDITFLVVTQNPLRRTIYWGLYHKPSIQSNMLHLHIWCNTMSTPCSTKHLVYLLFSCVFSCSVVYFIQGLCRGIAVKPVHLSLGCSVTYLPSAPFMTGPALGERTADITRPNRIYPIHYACESDALFCLVWISMLIKLSFSYH